MVVLIKLPLQILSEFNSQKIVKIVPSYVVGLDCPQTMFLNVLFMFFLKFSDKKNMFLMLFFKIRKSFLGSTPER